MFLYVIFIIIGFYLLIKGADFLIDGSIDIAKKFNIPSVIIGLTIVAIGTSMPEMIVSVTASLNNYCDMSIGNVLGSNISNLFLILGICSIIHPLVFKSKFENAIAIFSTIILFVFGNNKNTNKLTRIEGIILLCFAFLYILNNVRIAIKSNKSKEKSNYDISIIKAIFFIIIGIIGLKIGGDIVVTYSSKIAKALNFSEKFISVTLIAFSTSLPELITSINATLKKDTDMAIGNILGSQIFNIFLILGMSSLIVPTAYDISYNIDILFLFLGNIIFGIILGIRKKQYMTRLNGIFFIIMYAIYIVYNILKCKI